MKIEKVRGGKYKLSKGDVFIDSEAFLGVDFYLIISLNDNLVFGFHDGADLFLSDLNIVYLDEFSHVYKWNQKDGD